MASAAIDVIDAKDGEADVVIDCGPGDNSKEKAKIDQGLDPDAGELLRRVALEDVEGKGATKERRAKRVGERLVRPCSSAACAAHAGSHFVGQPRRRRSDLVAQGTATRRDRATSARCAPRYSEATAHRPRRLTFEFRARRATRHDRAANAAAISGPSHIDGYTQPGLRRNTKPSANRSTRRSASRIDGRALAVARSVAHFDRRHERPAGLRSKLVSRRSDLHGGSHRRSQGNFIGRSHSAPCARRTAMATSAAAGDIADRRVRTRRPQPDLGNSSRRSSTNNAVIVEATTSD